MPPLRTLAAGRSGAIGSAVVPGRRELVFVDYNAGTIHKVDLATGSATAIGGGYTLLEDIVVAPDGYAYVTERTGALLRVDLTNAARTAATSLHSGMVAPQQIALSADGARAYTVEYEPGGATGRLWRIPLSGPATPQVVLSGLHGAVGLALSADEQFALIGEQPPEGGRVSRYALTGGGRKTLAANLPAPFFLHWVDARRTRFLMPLRDPHNRVVQVDLAPRTAAVSDLLTGLPHRPSSVAITGAGTVAVCADTVVEEHAIPTGSAMKILGIVYDPPGPDIAAERIVLQNQGSEPVDLANWMVSDAAGHDYTFPAGTRAQAGEVVRLWTKTGADGGGDVYWNRGMAVWNNTPGDTARLRSASGTVVDTYPYQRPSVPLTPGAVTPVGPGGGGAMYAAVVSPHSASVLYAACDMGGLYRSDNGGADWTLLDARQVFVNESIEMTPPRRLTPTPMCCHPSAARADWVVAWGRLHGLRVSTDRGATWTTVARGTGTWIDAEVTALAIDPDTGRLFVGTTTGAHYHDPGSGGSWTGTAWQACSGVAGDVVSFVLLGAAAGQASHVLATRGSVWRSGDGGVTWSDVGAGLPATLAGQRRVNALSGGFNAALHPTAVLYATIPSTGTGTATDGGVYRSEDAGGSWTRLVGRPGLPAAAPGGFTIQFERAGVSPNNPMLVYVTAFAVEPGWRGNAEVFRSSDRGETWTAIWSGAALSGGWLDYERPGFGGAPLGFGVHQHSPGSGAATVAWTNMGCLYLTADPGGAAPAWREGYTKGTSQAAGQAWGSAGLEVTTVWQTYVDPHDPQRHYICYTDIGLMRSVDGGQTWTNWALPDWRSNVYELAFDPTTAGRVWAAATDHHDLPYEKELRHAPKSGGVVWSGDAGVNWQPRNAGLPDGPAVSVVLDPRSPAASRELWASVFRSGVFRTDNGGAAWHASSAGLPASPHAYRLHLHADGTLFCGLTGTGKDPATGAYPKQSALFRSFDRGGTWQQVGPLHEFVMDYAVHPVDSRVIYLCTAGVSGADGAVRRTTDGGATWTIVLQRSDTAPQQPLNRFHAFAPSLHPLDPNVVFVGTNTHGAWLSRDAGATWTRFGSVTFPRVQRFRVEPGQPGKVRIATHGVGVLDVALS